MVAAFLSIATWEFVGESHLGWTAASLGSTTHWPGPALQHAARQLANTRCMYMQARF